MIILCQIVYYQSSLEYGLLQSNRALSALPFPICPQNITFSDCNTIWVVSNRQLYNSSSTTSISSNTIQIRIDFRWSHGRFTCLLTLAIPYDIPHKGFCSLLQNFSASEKIIRSWRSLLSNICFIWIKKSETKFNRLLLINS